MSATAQRMPRKREKFRLEPVTPALLEEVVRRIVRAVDPDKIVLFGSYAKGSPREYSDLDLLVIGPGEDNRLAVAADIDGLFWDMSLPLDIIVLTPGEVARELAMANAFLRDQILGRGEVLYERAA